MLESAMIYTLIRTLPESIVLIVSGMIFLNIKIDIKSSVMNGILLGVSIYMIRTLPINFGVHTVLSMSVFGLIIYKISNNKIIDTIVCMAGVWIALILSEGIYVVITTQIFNIPFETLMNKDSLQGALITLPSLLIILGLVFLLKTTLLKIKNVIKREDLCQK